MKGKAILKRAPVRWDSGRWDIGGKSNMGVDSIPTLYDASVSGYLSTEYQSGVGYGNQLYLRELSEVDPGHPYYDSVPSGYMWVPEVQGGYFYSGQDEYYLFADKVTIVGTPDANGKLELGLYTDKYPTRGAPIIVTSGVSEFIPTEPFGKTYEPTPSGTEDRTPTKYRKRTDLSDRKEWQLDPSGNVIAYAFTLEDMEFTISASGNHPTQPSGWHRYIECYPSGDQITVEMEGGGSGYLPINYVDFNTLNTYEAHNTFLVVAPTGQLIPWDIDVNYMGRYLPEASQRVPLVAAVKDQWGAPVSGVYVTFAASVGTVDYSSVVTIWDGTAPNWCTLPDVQTISSAGTTITVTTNGISKQVWIPHGKVS